MRAVLGAVVGGSLGVGAVLAVLAWSSQPPRATDVAAPRISWGPPLRLDRVDRRAATAAALTAVVVFGVTRWPVLALAAALLVGSWHRLFGGSVAEYAARTEAIAGWVESLRDTMAASRGLEGAIATTARTAPAAIAHELEELTLEIEHGSTVRAALVRLGQRLAHPTADLVVATLVMAIDRDAKQISALLGELAGTAREHTAALLEVHAQRSATRSRLRIIVALAVGLMTMLIVGFGDFLAPYADPEGQVVLAGVLGVVGVGLAWMARLSRPAVAPRFLLPENIR